MPGLDPGIHVHRPARNLAWISHLDGRIKSGHDGRGVD